MSKDCACSIDLVITCTIVSQACSSTGSERCLANEGKKAIESMKRAEIDGHRPVSRRVFVLEIEAQVRAQSSDRLPDSTGWRQNS